MPPKAFGMWLTTSPDAVRPKEYLNLDRFGIPSWSPGWNHEESMRQKPVIFRQTGHFMLGGEGTPWTSWRDGGMHSCFPQWPPEAWQHLGYALSAFSPAGHVQRVCFFMVVWDCSGDNSDASCSRCETASTGTLTNVAQPIPNQLCISMHINAYQCISMHINAYQCISMLIYLSIIYIYTHSIIIYDLPFIVYHLSPITNHPTLFPIPVPFPGAFDRMPLSIYLPIYRSLHDESWYHTVPFHNDLEPCGSHLRFISCEAVWAWLSAAGGVVQGRLASSWPQWLGWAVSFSRHSAGNWNLALVDSVDAIWCFFFVFASAVSQEADLVRRTSQSHLSLIAVAGGNCVLLVLIGWLYLPLRNNHVSLGPIFTVWWPRIDLTKTHVFPKPNLVFLLKCFQMVNAGPTFQPSRPFFQVLPQISSPASQQRSKPCRVDLDLMSFWAPKIQENTCW